MRGRGRGRMGLTAYMTIAVDRVAIAQLDLITQLAGLNLLLRFIVSTYEVEPAASALAAGAGPPLAADVLQLGADLALVLCGKGALADPRRVSLDDADDAVDLGRIDGQPREDAAEARVAAGNVGVCTVVDIEHESIGALDSQASRKRSRSP